MSERYYTNEEYQTQALERIANSLEKHSTEKIKFHVAVAFGAVLGVFFTLVFRAAGVLP